jgi:predicted lipoprotein with Yx(FWY)xxD motif
MGPMLRAVLPVLLVVACASPDASTGEDPTPEATSSAPTSASTTPPAAHTGTVITTGPSDFGTMLFDERRQAIYIWELEESTTPECYDDCAVAWPPVLTEGKPAAEGKVRAGMLGTVRRRDGSMQVTYGGHPLYFYDHEGPGEVKCHDVATHGGLWWVLQPDGRRAP